MALRALVTMPTPLASICASSVDGKRRRRGEKREGRDEEEEEEEKG